MSSSFVLLQKSGLFLRLILLALIPSPVRKMLKAMEDRSEAMVDGVADGSQGELHRKD